MTTETLLTTAPSPSAADPSATTVVVTAPEAGTAPAAGENGATADTSATTAPETKTEAPAPVVPEKYEFTAPEGLALDESVTGALADVARDLKLPQTDAQKVIDAVGPKVVASIQAANQQAVQAAIAQWASDAKADKDIGGAKFDATMAAAAKARDAFGSPALKSLLDDSGLGNHPEVIRLFAKVGRAIGEDRMVTGNAPPSSGKTAAQVLYDATN